MPMISYKGLDVVSGATGDGGIALTDDFMELADRAPYRASSDPTSKNAKGSGLKAVELVGVANT